MTESMNFVQRIRSTAGNILNRFLSQKDEWKKVGKVVELNLYPLMYGKKLSVKRAFCSNEGLKYKDFTHWNFVIFELDSKKVCTFDNYPDLDKIDISYDECFSIVTLRSGSNLTKVILIEELEVDELFPAVIHSNKMLFLRDCGDIAAEWITDFLAHGATKLRLGLYQHSDSAIYSQSYSNYLNESPNNFMCKSHHLKTKNRFALLNTRSFDIIKDKERLSALHCNIEKYDFYPNILIKTDASEQFPEFTWKNIKIGDCVFENIDPCNKCTFDKVDAFFKDFKFENINFYTILKQNLRAKRIPADLTIDFKFSNNGERMITCGDGVYIR